MTTTLLRGGNLFVGTSKLRRADLLISAEGILEIAEQIDPSDERIDEVVELNGRAVLPGLIDSHVHLLVDGVDEMQRLHEPYSTPYYRATKVLRETLERGITTVRDAGGADQGLKHALAAGLIEGPQVLTAVTILGQTGGHSDGMSPCGVDLSLMPATPGRPSGVVNGPEEMRTRVRELQRAGADVIKICTTGGVLSPSDDPRHSQFAMDEIEMCVREAAVTGLGVMAHAQGPAGVLNAVNGGVRSIEHGIYATEECWDAMLERGTWLVPTLIAPVALLRAIDGGAKVSPAVKQKASDAVTEHMVNVRKAVNAGVRIAMGTDAGVFPHEHSLAELSLMQEAGLDPHQVIEAATVSAAELLGLSDRGRIEVGMRADVIVVDGDPFDFDGFADRVLRVFQAGSQRVSREI